MTDHLVNPHTTTIRCRGQSLCGATDHPSATLATATMLRMEVAAMWCLTSKQSESLIHNITYDESHAMVSLCVCVSHTHTHTHTHTHMHAHIHTHTCTHTHTHTHTHTYTFTYALQSRYVQSAGPWKGVPMTCTDANDTAALDDTDDPTQPQNAAGQHVEYDHRLATRTIESLRRAKHLGKPAFIAVRGPRPLL